MRWFALNARKKFWRQFRYSARTRVIIDEKSVRIVQRMKNPTARKSGNRLQVAGHSNAKNKTTAPSTRMAQVEFKGNRPDLKKQALSAHVLMCLKTMGDFRHGWAFFICSCCRSLALPKPLTPGAGHAD